MCLVWCISHWLWHFCGLVPIFLLWDDGILWPDLAQEKVLGGIYCRAGGWRWVIFMASCSQGGFPPILSPSFPSTSSFKRLCNTLGSSLNHRFLSFSAEKHKRSKGHVLCVKHRSLQNFWDATVLDGRATKFNLYITINLEWQIEWCRKV